jgi:type IV pilus assembly protein PilC
VKKHGFSWSGLNPSGQKTKGLAYELNADLLKLALAKQGLQHIKVKRQFSFFSKKIRSKDITYFARQLLIMQKAGLPLLKALQTLSVTSGPLEMIIAVIKKDIERGKTLSDSLRKFPKQFDRLFCNLIEVGEAAGILDQVLQNLVEYREKSQGLKSALFKALSYPIIVLLVALGISIGLLLFIVPQFQTLFTEFNAPLPLLTQTVIHVSNALKQNGLWIMAGIVGAGAAGMLLKKQSETFKQIWDKALLSLPVFGKLIQKALLIKISRTLSLMLNAGMPLSQALRLLTKHFENRAYKFAMTKCFHSIKNGQAFHQALSHSNYFPILLIQMVQVGEESGTLDSMLSKAADIYQEELDYAVSILKELLEPVLMTVLGIIVGGLVIAMYLPVFNLGGIM